MSRSTATVASLSRRRNSSKAPPSTKASSQPRVSSSAFQAGSACFVAEVDPDVYLKGATDAILSRFLGNDDPMSRILARFQAPTPERPDTVEAFRQRFADRVDGPIAAYAETRGAPPPAATHSLESLARLIASETYINAA